jgi:branched-chain amino acid transport system permease protein
VRSPIFFLIALAVGGGVFGIGLLIHNDYAFYAGYVVLQFIVLATAWNVLGGYCGYVNFGSAAFFALGAYSSVAIHKFVPMKTQICLWGACTGEGTFGFLAPLFPMPIPVLVVVGGVVSGVVGLGMGYLTLRLRGAFFAIATLALAVVLQTMVVNWDYVGGSRGAYIIRPPEVTFAGITLGYIQYLFLIMILLSVIALTVARLIERSRLGYGFATIRDDELAAEACGVPTLRLKLVATTISGALMGMAGAPFPYYIGYLEPGTAFGLSYGVNSIAMPMIGGTTSWFGPLIGAILLGTLQQVATVTISSAVNLLIVGLLLVDCVILAPKGIVGLIRDRQSAFATMVEPSVFALLYVINLLPLFFLAHQGQAARWLGLVFWGFLLVVAYARGQIIRQPWLILFPIVGAFLSVLPVTDTTPVISTLLGWSRSAIWAPLDGVIIMLAIATIIQAFGIFVGATPKRHLEEVPAR